MLPSKSKQLSGGWDYENMLTVSSAIVAKLLTVLKFILIGRSKFFLPNQNQTKLLSKLLHCSRNGTELGWLIDAEIESIIAIFPEQKVEIFIGSTQLPILSEIQLELTAEQFFSWLNFT